jgi:hypothetical protein
VRTPRSFAFALALAGALALGFTGCGAERGTAPDLPTTAVDPGKVELFVQEGEDVTFSYPQNWHFQERRPPGVATVATGGAEITVWAYRSQSTVVTVEDAAEAMDRYLASLKERDPAFRVQKSKTVSTATAYGFEVIGRTEISGRKVRVRSVHVYRGRGEYVVDAISDPEQFAEVNTEVMQPLLQSTFFVGFPRLADPVQEAGD